MAMSRKPSGKRSAKPKAGAKKKAAPKKKAAAKKPAAKKPAVKKSAARKPPRKSSPAAKRSAPPKKKAAAAPKAKPRKSKAPARRSAAPPPTPPMPPSAIGLLGHHSDYTTHDLDAVRTFYTELLGFTQFYFDPKMNYLFISTAPGASLGFMPPMSNETAEAIGADLATMPGPPPKEPTLYFIVTDVDAVYRHLREKGVTFVDTPSDQPWGHRTVTANDPEGRTLMFATPRQTRAG